MSDWTYRDKLIAARAFRAEGMDLAQIAEALELSEEEMKKLAGELDKPSEAAGEPGGEKRGRDYVVEEKFLELRGVRGLSYDRIAEEIHVSKPTLIKWSRTYERDISNLREIRLEALREKYSLTKQAQIELLGTQLQAIKAELSKRDLSAIPTEKLLMLMLKFCDAADPADGGLRLRQYNSMAGLDLSDGLGKEETWNG